MKNTTQTEKVMTEKQGKTSIKQNVVYLGVTDLTNIKRVYGEDPLKKIFSNKTIKTQLKKLEEDSFIFKVSDSRQSSNILKNIEGIGRNIMLDRVKDFIGGK